MGMQEDEELCTLRWEDISTPPTQNLFVWRDAVRHHNAQIALARQIALKEAGSQWPTYFKKHRAKLMAEAADIIATRPGFAAWRFRR